MSVIHCMHPYVCDLKSQGPVNNYHCNLKVCRRILSHFPFSQLSLCLIILLSPLSHASSPFPFSQLHLCRIILLCPPLCPILRHSSSFSLALLLFIFTA